MRTLNMFQEFEKLVKVMAMKIKTHLSYLLLKKPTLDSYYAL